MDSGIIVDAVNWKEKSRWTENSIVYTRRTLKKARKTISNNDTANTTTESAAATTAAENPTTTPAPTKVSSPTVASAAPAEASTTSTSTSTSGDHVVPESQETLVTKNTDATVGEQQSTSQTEARNLKNDSLQKSNGVAQILIESSPLPIENGLPKGPTNDNNGSAEFLGVSKVDDRVRFKLTKRPKTSQKDEIKFLREKLDSELDQVSRLFKQLEEAKQLHLASYNSQVRNSNLSNNNNSSRVFASVNSDMMGPTILAGVNSDVGSARIEPRPFHRQLNVAVMENNYAEKEKRTPKANQYYRNSEFLLGKDRLPPENMKRSKTSKGRKHGFGFGFNKSCSSLLQRLMKHKHGWVFNNPVDVNVLGLVDYHDIIKHPMDLGTIKNCLSKNQYKSPMEFADDVRLVFRNAMTYNPKGHEVHVMAEELLQIFDDRWVTMESEFNYRKATQQSHFTIPVPLYAPASAHLRTASSIAIDSKVQRPNVGRTPVPKKPKARDENKRDMMYDEKQRLSSNLQNLPSEKLDAVVQIIKRRNTELSQIDDEIEVDIDNVDTETLWELDRFVTNYKKSLSKNKRKAELAVQAREAANRTVALTNTNTAVADGQINSGTASGKKNVLPSDDGENQGYNGRSSSSSSSSSDSGSSSSDSDSDSSSANGSDAGNSPGT